MGVDPVGGPLTGDGASAPGDGDPTGSAVGATAGAATTGIAGTMVVAGSGADMTVNVTVWNENVHERRHRIGGKQRVCLDDRAIGEVGDLSLGGDVHVP